MNTSHGCTNLISAVVNIPVDGGGDVMVLVGADEGTGCGKRSRGSSMSSQELIKDQFWRSASLDVKVETGHVRKAGELASELGFVDSEGTADGIVSW